MEKQTEMEKQTLTRNELAEMLNIGISNANKIMREIKAVSDTLRISGLVHIQDYRYWLYLRRGIGTKKYTAEEQEQE